MKRISHKGFILLRRANGEVRNRGMLVRLYGRLEAGLRESQIIAEELHKVKCGLIVTYHL